MRTTYSFYVPLQKLLAQVALVVILLVAFPAPAVFAVSQGGGDETGGLPPTGEVVGGGNQGGGTETNEGVAGPNTQIKLCHKNQGASVYSEVQAKASAIVAVSNEGHPPSDNHAGDVIPPFHYNFGVDGSGHFEGRNWNATTEIIWNNGCNIPEPSADLSIVKIADDSVYREGEDVIYTIIVENKGPDAATNVVVTDPMAAGLTYTFASINPDSTNPLTWNIGSLAKNATWTVVVIATVANDAGGQTITNTATVTGTEEDKKQNNNSASETIRVIDTVFGCMDRDATNYNRDVNQDDGSCLFPLTVVKQFGGDTSATPNQFSFTINGGAPIVFEADGTNVVPVAVGAYDVVEVLAPGFSTTYDSCTDIVIDGSGDTCTITNTPIDQTKYGTLEIKKVVTGIDGTPDYTAFSYALNGGAAVAFDDDGIVSFAAPVGMHTVTEPAVVGYTTSYNNCENLTIIEGQTTTCTITNDYEPVVNPKAIDLSITKVADDTTPEEGDTVTYTLTVANAGPDTATNVVVSDTIPAGTTFVSANPVPADVNVNPLTWNIASLTSGASTVITVVVTVDDETAGDTITNTATVDAAENDTDPSDDSVMEDIVVETPGQLCVAEPNGGWADFFSDADQKLRKDGSVITDSARTNPGAVIGAADWASGGSTGFFSLGFGGSITVGFDSYVPNVTGADISIHEATNGAGYPEESAMIEVSQDGELWKEIGTASNQNNLVTRVTDLDFDSTGWSWIKYVRVTDTSDVADFTDSYTSETMPDGFDLDAVDATQTVCDKPADPTKSCVATLVSGTDSDENNRDDYTTVDELSDALAWVITPHELWPAVTGAGWIWGDEVVQNTALGETQTFERTFGWQGTVTSATLTVSSDDSHSAALNGNVAGSKLSASHVSGQGVYNVTSLIQQGNNTLSIEVTNIGNNNPEWNPAGLAYKLVIEGTVASEADCLVPYNDEPLYEIYGYVWHDENENDNWDGSEFDNSESLIEDGELPLAGWTVSITNGTLNFATQTDALGRYEFNVPAGTWTITETVKTDWSQTFPNSGSHIVTVPEPFTAADSAQGFFASLFDRLIPTVYAETVYPTSYGAYNFGNVFTGTNVTPLTPSSSSSGGNGRRISLRETPRGEVLGESTGLGGALPTPGVLGVATSIVPVGAPNTGAGGSAPQGTTPIVVAILSPTVSLRTSRNG